MLGLSDTVENNELIFGTPEQIEIQRGIYEEHNAAALGLYFSRAFNQFTTFLQNIGEQKIKSSNRHNTRTLDIASHIVVNESIKK